MLLTKHRKEDVLNEKSALKKLLTYMTSVYKIPQKIKCLPDKRERKSILLFNKCECGEKDGKSGKQANRGVDFSGDCIISFIVDSYFRIST